MAIVLQASLGAAPSPAKGDDSNVQQLKSRIHELEQETEELSKKYNEELKTERVNNRVCNFVEGLGKNRTGNTRRIHYLPELSDDVNFGQKGSQNKTARHFCPTVRNIYSTTLSSRVRSIKKTKSFGAAKSSYAITRLRSSFKALSLERTLLEKLLQTRKNYCYFLVGLSVKP